MHERPRITRYTAAEILELLGPVETQYCTDCDINVQVADTADQMVVNVNAGACPEFDEVMLEFADPEGPLNPLTFTSDQGSRDGDTWSVVLVPADIGDVGDFEYGRWSVTCTLSIREGADTSCSTGFEVFD